MADGGWRVAGTREWVAGTGEWSSTWSQDATGAWQTSTWSQDATWLRDAAATGERRTSIWAEVTQATGEWQTSNWWQDVWWNAASQDASGAGTASMPTRSGPSQQEVSSAMRKVFPEPADANNERRKFRKFQEVCDLDSASDHMSSNAYKDVATSFDVSFSGTYINL